MARDPWTDPDPQPGDFDAEIEAMDPRDIQFHEGNPDAKVTIIAGYTRGPDGRIDSWWKPGEEPPRRRDED
jgi:hypothetical protein